MVPFAVPVVATARLLGTDLTHHHVLGRLEKWTAAWVAALSLGLFFLTARELSDARSAAVASLILAVGSVFATTSSQALWQQGGVIFWSLAALLLECRRETRPVPGGTLLQGLAGAMMLACRPSAALFLVLFGVWVLVRSPRRGLLLAGCTCLAYLPWAVGYTAIYGTPVGPASTQMQSSCWGEQPLRGLAGVLFSPSRGLFTYQPWLVLAVGAFLVGRSQTQEEKPRAGPAGWRWFCLSAVAAQVILVSLWNCWWGGDCWGSRLLAEVVPLGALLCLEPLRLRWSSPRFRILVGGLTLAAVLVQAPGMYLNSNFWSAADDLGQHPNRLWSWTHPPFLYRFQHFHVSER
jgi:hypothetical protein